VPTYHEIMTADLHRLVVAAGQWEDMAGQFASQEGDYAAEVHGVAAGAGRPGAWTGVAATTAGSVFDATLAEYGAARKEALAVAALLRDAYAQFTALRTRLESVRKEAEAAGLRVSERGTVAVDTAGRPPRPGETCGSAEGWQQRIDNAVRAVDDADQGVVIALRAVTQDEQSADGAPGGFNAGALSDVEQYEARAGSALAARMAKGERLNAAEVDELRRLFRDNQHDEDFSRAFLGGLGADGLLTVGSRANDLAHTAGGGDGRARGMADIVSGLSRTLATATRDTDSPWYERWRSDMREAGLDEYASRFAADRMTHERGYQSLVGLMAQGGRFGSQYLADLGDDMIAAEREDPEVWDMVGPVAGKDGWFANDPLDGVLGIMSRDPEGAAAYLRDEARVKYLAEERDWRTVVDRGTGGLPDHGTEHADADLCAGFGAALEAAATGIGPHAAGAGGFVEHTEANDEVFQHAVRHLAAREDEFPPTLREGMGRVLANHGDTVHRVASAFGGDATPVTQSDLFEVAKQVSRDPQGYAALNMGLNTPMVDAIHRPEQMYPKDSLIQAARTVGFVEEIRAQSVGLEARPPRPPEWAAVTSGVAAHVPVVGSEVQMGIDAVTESWLKDEQARFDEGVRAGREDDYRARERQLQALTETWWRVHGAGDGPPPHELQTQVNLTAMGGMDHGRGITGAPR
jgi:hypothetical protein